MLKILGGRSIFHSFEFAICELDLGNLKGRQLIGGRGRLIGGSILATEQNRIQHYKNTLLKFHIFYLEGIRTPHWVEKPVPPPLASPLYHVSPIKNFVIDVRRTSFASQT